MTHDDHFVIVFLLLIIADCVSVFFESEGLISTKKEWNKITDL